MIATTELEDDGLPPIVPLKDFLKQDIQPPQAHEVPEDFDIDEDDDEDDDDYNYNAWEEFQKQVGDNWLKEAVELRKWIEANKIDVKVAPVTETIEVEDNRKPVKPIINRRPLPAIVNWGAIVLDEAIVQPMQIIEGILYKGCKLVFGGPSKSKKSWALLDLALAVANGLKWLNYFQCNVGRVLYINFELIPYDIKKRGEILAKDIIKNKNHNVFANVEMWNLRGFAEDIEELAIDITEELTKHDYALLIIDPVYKTLGDRDENSSGNIANLLNHIDKICVETNTSVAFGAHFPKGNMGGRTSMDRIAGSSVFARDPDAIITMSPAVKKTHPTKEGEITTESEIPGLFNVETVLRSFQEPATFTVKWEFPRMVPQDYVAKTEGSRGRPNKVTIESIYLKIASSMPEGLTKKQLSELFECTQKTIQRHTAELEIGCRSMKISRENAKTPWKIASKPAPKQDTPEPLIFA